MSLALGIAKSRSKNPEKIALAFRENSWTYAEFDDTTDAIAGNLLAQGLRPGDRIALHLLNGSTFALACIGCLKAGCAVVPVNTRLKGREVDYILRHSGSACYIGQSELYSQVIDTCSALAAIDLQYLEGACSGSTTRRIEDLFETNPAPPAHLTVRDDQLAAILYTSGTTAHPKGVMHSHRTLIETARAMCSMNLDEDQVVLITSSMSHMVGFGMLLLPSLFNGATVVITRPFEFRQALQAHARWRVTYALSLPVIFHELLLAQVVEPHNTASGRFYYCGGDCVSPALQQGFQSKFAPLCEVYGSTEVAPVSWNRPGRLRVGSLGQTGTGVALRLLSSSGRDVNAGEVGELCIQAKHLMLGYWQDPEATSSAMRDAWFHTGDLARCDAEGYYWFAGRKKEIIIRGGSNISPQEVEAALSEHPSVSEAAVVGRAHRIWGEVAVAHVVLRDGRAVEEKDLIAFARERIADYKVPEEVIFQTELPRTPTGKIHRRALRERERAAELCGK